MTDFTTITACGECCVGCTKSKKAFAQGASKLMDGFRNGQNRECAESGMCKIHACCKEHNARFCGLCAEFPCTKLPNMIPWNPEIIRHLSALRDEYRIQGLEDK